MNNNKTLIIEILAMVVTPIIGSLLFSWPITLVFYLVTLMNIGMIILGEMI